MNIFILVHNEFVTKEGTLYLFCNIYETLKAISTLNIFCIKLLLTSKQGSFYHRIIQVRQTDYILCIVISYGTNQLATATLYYFEKLTQNMLKIFTSTGTFMYLNRITFFYFYFFKLFIQLTKQQHNTRVLCCYLFTSY